MDVMSIPPSGVTLTTLLGDPALRLGRAAVADADLGLAVTAAAVSELTEPGPWLEGGELLLTVGFLLPSDVDGLTGYCRHLREHGVAALGIGLGADLPHRRTPEALVTAARRAGLALLAVPDGVPFVAVTRAVFAHRDAAERARLQWALRTQRALTAAAVAPGGPAAVLTAHAEATGRSAVVVDLLGRVLAAAPPDGADTLAAELSGTVAAVRRRGLLGAAVESAGGRRREVHPLGSHRIRALLLVDGPARGGHSNQVTGDLVSLLSLDLERRAGLDAAGRRERARLLTTLERGVVDDAVAGRRLAAAGLAEQPLRAAVVAAPRPDELAADLAAVLPDALVRVVRDAPGAPAGRVELAAPASAPLDTVLATLAAGRPAGVGIVVRPGALAVSLRQARSALPVARLSGRPVHAADVASARMLLALLDHERLGGFADAVLGPFDADPRGPELLRAVAAFVEHNGHWEATATALGVHRHTVRNRITAAEQVSGRRLSAAQDRHELWLALQARDLGRAGTDGVSPGGNGADRL
ncbi:PucR family transcriptional regulator ligand-binding domain-containing protein [Pseudonocardia sp. DR1-2]|uniref:PucR family transcriptional regulator n=1 Tax=Pseudonocardia sp. DR1-2 TaxID=2951168 RepID=UPI0020437C07|nr:PucR family transcriptional regulator [Pseudonocardia sp. DR1-2]MCM3848859.1 PucR family transcriptional regulator ligand-binding domain-containing protein [Pseudonocardia sp. DR1-2]